MSINQFLADHYGNPSGFEKMASPGVTEAELIIWDAFEKRAAADGIDVNDLEDNEVDALYDHYTSEDGGYANASGGEVEFPANWDADDVNHFANLDEDGREQFAQFKEAEFLGEVIAHSQFSTLRKLAEAEAQAPGAFRRGATWAGEHAAKGRDFAINTVKAHPKSSAGLLATTTAATGYGVGRSKGRKLGPKTPNGEKTAEAIEFLALERAREFLKTAGIDPDTGNAYGNVDPIDQRAAELLIENGYGELLS